MNINYILENEELKKLLSSAIEKTYYKFSLSFIIEKKDFEQEVYIFIMERIKNFDNEKSSLRTYIPLLVMTCARRCIYLANGNSKKHNKLEFRNSILSLDYEIETNEGTVKLANAIGDFENVDNKILIDEILKLKVLSEKEKEIIRLKAEGYTTADISLILRKTTSCINITFQRAREKIVRKYA